MPVPAYSASLAKADSTTTKTLPGRAHGKTIELVDDAGVTGDWREEIIMLSGNELHVYENRATKPRPNERRLRENRD
jgi:hypothetical protein